METSAIRTGLGAVVRFLNRPLIKEGVKNVAGAAAFAFGVIEGCDIYQGLQGQKISTESTWVQVAAKISLILSALTSRPGAFILSKAAGCVFSQGELERLFGANTIFAVNPWHPRHVFSIAAVIFALPSVVQSTYRAIHWSYTKLCGRETLPAAPRQEPWLTDTKIRLMTLFNTTMSRPAQHLVNQLCRAILAR